ncbi:HpaA family protein [Helicobacter felis]|uniref:HpaA family protein n=1 Tax=Helicobacter felis TaxID=214 RepID=UPI000CEDE7C6|nr:HpaA family protein [Helicobacter felis]
MYKRLALCAFLGFSSLTYAATAPAGKYVYDLHEKAQPKNHYTLALAPLSIDFSKNVPTDLRDKFVKSLQAQITSMLKARGCSVVVAPLDKLSPEQQESVFALVDVSAFIDILEDTDMTLSKNKKSIEENITDISTGFMRLKLIEPKSKSAFHMSSMELPSYKVRTHVRVSQQRTSSGGFMPISHVTPVHGAKFEKNIDEVLSKIYAKSMQKIAQDLHAQNFKSYERLVKNFKKSEQAEQK